LKTGPRPLTTLLKIRNSLKPASKRMRNALSKFTLEFVAAT